MSPSRRKSHCILQMPQNPSTVNKFGVTVEIIRVKAKWKN